MQRNSAHMKREKQTCLPPCCTWPECVNDAVQLMSPNSVNVCRNNATMARCETMHPFFMHLIQILVSFLHRLIQALENVSINVLVDVVYCMTKNSVMRHQKRWNATYPLIPATDECFKARFASLFPHKHVEYTHR